MSLTIARVDRVFNAINLDNINNKNAKWASRCVRVKKIAKYEGPKAKFFNWLFKCFRGQADTRKKEMVDNLVFAVMAFTGKADAMNPEDTVSQISMLAKRLETIDLSPGKLKLEIHSNEHGKICLSLRAIFPAGSKSILLKTFDENSAEVLSKDSDKYDVFKQLYATTKTFNDYAGHSHDVKTYVDCAFDGTFDEIDDENKVHEKPCWFNFLGTNCKQEDADALIFCRQQRQKGKEYCHVFDGPQGIKGRRFDRIIGEGLYKVLIAIVIHSRKDIRLSGHSRGGCIALAINNILIAASEGDIVEAERLFPRSLPEGTKKLLLNLLGRLVDKEFRVTLNMFDPVRGPKTGPCHHTGFKAIENLYINKDSKVIFLACSNNYQHLGLSCGFDMHLPKVKVFGRLEKTLAHKQIRCLAFNVEHGGATTPPTNDVMRLGFQPGGWEAYAVSARILDMINDFKDQKFLKEQRIMPWDDDCGENRKRFAFNNPFPPLGRWVDRALRV